jgi:HEAT repeat protein
MARRRLARGDALDRLLALRTFGYLARPEDYPEVVRWLDDRRTYLCIAAARALVQMDPHRAPGDLLPRLARRVDWPVALFASTLAGAGPEATARQLREVLRGLPVTPLVRLLPLVTVVDGRTADEILGELLASSSDPEILCAALKRAESPRLLPHVRRACAHPEWAVRTQAAAVLGRVGEKADRQPLLLLLCDPGWWVRYRAAQALLSGRFGTAKEIAALVPGLGDRYAHDILEHVLAEVRG